MEGLAFADPGVNTPISVSEIIKTVTQLFSCLVLQLHAKMEVQALCGFFFLLIQAFPAQGGSYKGSGDL